MSNEESKPGYNPRSLDASLANIFVRLDMQDKTLGEVKVGVQRQLDAGEDRFRALEDWRRESELEKKWFKGWLACALSAVCLAGSAIGILVKIFIFGTHGL